MSWFYRLLIVLTVITWIVCFSILGAGVWAYLDVKEYSPAPEIPVSHYRLETPHE